MILVQSRSAMLGGADVLPEHAHPSVVCEPMIWVRRHDELRRPFGWSLVLT
jgi:hypothetical protein